MKSKWRVMFNPIAVNTPYAVYRLKNIYDTDHFSNCEIAPGMYATKAQAKAKAAEMNGGNTDE